MGWDFLVAKKRESSESIQNEFFWVQNLFALSFLCNFPHFSLARAMYRKADIYLIDDPLSAVDTRVQSHLFDECIGQNGFLARQNSTRILITHQLHFLNEANWIIALKDVTNSRFLLINSHSRLCISFIGKD